MPDYVKLIRKSGDINALAKKHKAKVAAALAESAQVGASIAKQLAPRGSRSYVDKQGLRHPGALKASIFIQQDGELTFRIGASVPYASYVELGVPGRQEAQPYIRPALKLAQEHLRNILKVR